MKDSAPEENQMASLPSKDDGNDDNVMEVNGTHEPVELFKPPRVYPRIGDEFQVEIPPPSLEYRCSVDLPHYLQNFLIGLPIPCFRQELETPSINDVKSESSRNEKSRISFWVPGLRTETWSDSHKASFLLGVYIFQKDFVKVKQFIETKEMGDVLSFYYAEFCGSDIYRRWSVGRKRKSKRCVQGHMIFSGWRQQELLSRLKPKMTEHWHNALVEASKRFSDETMTLVEYVSYLKTMVGMSTLVEAIGIGTGKRDLTRMSLEPSRSNRAAPVRPGIPTGKACASLANSEMINFIKNHRLSKSQSSDLFWEAVWPRLLARGWHSELPKDQGSRNNLVFLMPDVKKFSRRKHKIGKQYFDSITDILNKVGKEPELIELDCLENNGRKTQEVLKVEQESEQDSEEDDDGSPPTPRVSYLQPRTPSRDSGAVPFTNVDTGVPGGKVKELRSLPTKVLSLQTCQNHAEDSHEETDVPESMKQSGDKTKSCKEMIPASSNLKNKIGLHKQKHSKVSKSLPSEKIKRINEDNAAPIKKKSRKSAASRLEKTGDVTSHSCPAPRFENGMSSCSSSILNTEKLSSRMGTYQDKTSTTSSSKGSPSESIECAPYGNNIRTSEPSLGTVAHTLIDLNVCQMPPELESASMSMQTSREQDVQTPKAYNHRSPLNAFAIGSINEQEPTKKNQNAPALGPIKAQEPIENNRRHSTRTRPPTTRVLQALEAGILEAGLLSVAGRLPEKRRRKSKDVSSNEELAHRPSSQRTRRAARPAISTNSIVSPQTEEAENGSKCNESCSSQGQPQANEEDSGSGVHESTLPAKNELTLFW